MVALAPHKGHGADFVKIGLPGMPTLFRLLMTLGILAGIGYGSMVALALFVEPNKGEMTVRIAPERLNPQRN